MAFPYNGVKGCLAPVAGAPAVELDGVTVGYPGSRRPVLDGVSLQIPARSVVALVGPNGCGKSTLLKTITGVLAPSAGTVRTFGHGRGLCHHRVAYLPQRDQIQWQIPMSVERVVLAGRYVHLGWFRRPSRQDRQAVSQALGIMNIDDLANRQIHDLSGGQRQRVMIARALAQEADLFLFDEPLNALDAESRTAVRETFVRLVSMRKTILVATHEFQGFEGLFDTLVRMEGGRIEEVAPLPANTAVVGAA